MAGKIYLDWLSTHLKTKGDVIFLKKAFVKVFYLLFIAFSLAYIPWGFHVLGEFPPLSLDLSVNQSFAGQDSSEQTPTSRPRPVNVEHTSQDLLYTLSYLIMQNNQLVSEYVYSDPIFMSNADDYAELEGVTGFRGNNFRNSPSFGNAHIDEAKLGYLWSVPIGRLDEWTGVGWNGQPAIVKWNDFWKPRMNLVEGKKEKSDLKEVIYAALDGRVYFLDLDDGKPTRPVINIPGPVKGSLTVDPRGIPLLYVGQGIDNVHGRKVEIGYRLFSLIDQQKLFFINGNDKFALRGWGAFDSTALVDAKTDTMLLGGENGLFYRVKLNSYYNEAENYIGVNPEVAKYRYVSWAKANHQGIENSVAVYKNFAYFADNGGVLQCLDVNTMQPVWARDVSDDTDSTCVLEEEDEKNVFLYTACEVDRQGPNGYSYLRKFDALTGEPQWEKKIKCFYNAHTNGGALATPVIGKQDIDNLVIYNIARFATPGGGVLVALDKYTGQQVWQVDMTNYCWSSPVDVYTDKGEAYLVVCDSGGRMFLIKGKTGEVVDSISLGANVEGSPAVYDNTIVVGTRGQRIYGIIIK